jgi:hypothetical protein
MRAAASWMLAVKEVSVLSARMAMRLNSLSLQKKFIAAHPALASTSPRDTVLSVLDLKT